VRWRTPGRDTGGGQPFEIDISARREFEEGCSSWRDGLGAGFAVVGAHEVLAALAKTAGTTLTVSKMGRTGTAGGLVRSGAV
jgi:hypothetical protein